MQERATEAIGGDGIAKGRVRNRMTFSFETDHGTLSYIFRSTRWRCTKKPPKNAKRNSCDPSAIKEGNVTVKGLNPSYSVAEKGRHLAYKQNLGRSRRYCAESTCLVTNGQLPFFPTLTMARRETTKLQGAEKATNISNLIVIAERSVFIICGYAVFGGLYYNHFQLTSSELK